jgi:hypothetical protein
VGVGSAHFADPPSYLERDAPVARELIIVRDILASDQSPRRDSHGRPRAPTLATATKRSLGSGDSPSWNPSEARREDVGRLVSTRQAPPDLVTSPCTRAKAELPRRPPRASPPGLTHQRPHGQDTPSAFVPSSTAMASF